MQKLFDYYDKLPNFLKNKYGLTLGAFLIWILFFDTHTLTAQFKLKNTLVALKAKKTYFEKEIKIIEQDLDELLSNEESLEKFAREAYFMKKKDEEIFIIVTEEE